MKTTPKDRMTNKLTTQEIVSLVVIAVAAPVLALAFVVSVRAIALAENDLLLFSLTLCGALVSGINGFGRRTIKARVRSGDSRIEQRPGVALLS